MPNLKNLANAANANYKIKKVENFLKAYLRHQQFINARLKGLAKMIEMNKAAAKTLRGLERKR